MGPQIAWTQQFGSLETVTPAQPDYFYGTDSWAESNSIKSCQTLMGTVQAQTKKCLSFTEFKNFLRVDTIKY